MSLPVLKDNHPISKELISIISKRYKRITRAVNTEFWNSESESAHSRYVGSYGRGTAVNTSDLDVLIELPNVEYDHFTSMIGNGPSRLLQAVKNSILDTYPYTSIKADGQVVVINFSDGIKFEILPAFKNMNYWGNWNGTFKYPDTHMGGNWMTTNPLAEQEAMDEKDNRNQSNGLLKDTCKHIRLIKADYYSSYHLSGIMIDSFVYHVIGSWHWPYEGEVQFNNSKTFEEYLVDCYNRLSFSFFSKPLLYAPGSGMKIDTDDWEVLGKVLYRMV